MRTQIVHTQPRLGSLPLTVRRPVRFIVGCPTPGCRFCASSSAESRGTAEGRALRGLAAHLIRMHQQGGHCGQSAAHHD